MNNLLNCEDNDNEDEEEEEDDPFTIKINFDY